MPKQKEPIRLVVEKGKKHLTKEEIETRLQTEIEAPSDKVEAPKFLSAAEKKEFEEIAKELIRIGIMSNLDCDVLAYYVQSRRNYRKYDKILCGFFKKNISKTTGKELPIDMNGMEQAERMRDKALKQCRSLAQDLGLTISSRCKLVVPKPAETPKKNKFSKFDTG